MDVELWERLEYHAPLQRRSVTNLLQKLVADGLDRLDDEEGHRQLVKNTHELLRHVPSERVKDALEWQKKLLDEVRAGKPLRLNPLPPRGMTRRRKPKQRP